MHGAGPTHMDDVMVIEETERERERQGWSWRSSFTGSMLFKNFTGN